VRALLAALLLLVSTAAFTQVGSYYPGMVLSHGLSVCLKKEDVIAIAKVEAEQGYEAAEVAFMAYEALDACHNVPVLGALVGKVVYKTRVTRNDKPLTLSVIEIVDPETKEVKAYFSTTWSYDMGPGGRGA
jgi:hypothetical protein